MAQTRDNYQVQANSLPELILSLNLLLQRMADRMDKIEGIRGNPEVFASLDMNGNQITDVLQSSNTTDAVNQSELAGQDLDTTDSPTFANLTITTNISTSNLSASSVASSSLTVTGTSSLGNIEQVEANYYKYTDSNGTIIHSFATIT